MSAFHKQKLLWLVAACCLSGCWGRGDRPELGTVTGTVYLDDKPLDDVWVMFNPTAGGRTSMGQTDKNGKYTLMYLDGIKGANLGNHNVAITKYHEDELLELRFNGIPAKEVVPPKYNTSTILTAEVKEGANTIDFKLTSE